MKRIFVCSPLRSTEIYTMKENIEFAKLACQFVVRMGDAPFAPHLMYTQFMNDKNPDDRRRGQEMAMEFLKTCDELWVFRRSKIDINSEGMSAEISEAVKLHLKVVEVIDLEKGKSGEKICGLVFGDNNESWTLYTV